LGQEASDEEDMMDDAEEKKPARKSWKAEAIAFEEANKVLLEEIETYKAKVAELEAGKVEKTAEEMIEVAGEMVAKSAIPAPVLKQLQEMQKQKQALGFEYNKFKAYEDKVAQYNNNLVRYTNAKIVWDDKLTCARNELVLAQKELDNLIDLQLQIVDIPSLEEQISTLNSEKANIELNNRIGKVFIESTNRLAELRSDLANKTYVLDNANILVKALKLVLTKTIENGLKNLQHKINN